MDKRVKNASGRGAGRGLTATRVRILATLLAVALLLSSGLLPGTVEGFLPMSADAGPAVPPFGHVFVIMMENKSYGDIIGSPDAPYVNSLAAQYGLASSYYAIVSHSLPNYLAMVSGSTQSVLSGDCPGCYFASNNLVDQLEQNGRTWKAYMEGMPQPCYSGNSAAAPASDGGALVYLRRHNPFMYFGDVAGNPARCDNVVPFGQFATDLQNNTLPDFVWISPNLVHDMHDGTVQQGDSWLSAVIPQILASPSWQDGGVLFLVWDEGAFSADNQSAAHTLALVVSPDAKPGYASGVPYNHYSVLRTIEDAWGLGYLGQTGDAYIQPMADFFK